MSRRAIRKVIDVWIMDIVLDYPRRRRRKLSVVSVTAQTLIMLMIGLLFTLLGFSGGQYAAFILIFPSIVTITSVTRPIRHRERALIYGAACGFAAGVAAFYSTRGALSQMWIAFASVSAGFIFGNAALALTTHLPLKRAVKRLKKYRASIKRQDLRR